MREAVAMFFYLGVTIACGVAGGMLLFMGLEWLFGF